MVDNIKMNEIKKILSNKDYKLTPQRQAIIQIFYNNQEEHLSAEEVLVLVKKEGYDIGLATVYRTLDLLAQLEILRSFDFGDGKNRYELSDCEEHHHHHLICLNCGKVSEFNEDLLESLESLIFRKNKFKVTNHQCKMFGICQECQDSERIFPI